MNQKKKVKGKVQWYQSPTEVANREDYLKVHQKEKQGLLQEKTKGLLHLCRMWAGDRRGQKQPGKGAGQRPPG